MSFFFLLFFFFFASFQQGSCGNHLCHYSSPKDPTFPDFWRISWNSESKNLLSAFRIQEFRFWLKRELKGWRMKDQKPEKIQNWIFKQQNSHRTQRVPFQIKWAKLFQLFDQLSITLMRSLLPLMICPHFLKDALCWNFASLLLPIALRRENLIPFFVHKCRNLGKNFSVVASSSKQESSITGLYSAKTNLHTISRFLPDSIHRFTPYINFGDSGAKGVPLGLIKVYSAPHFKEIQGHTIIIQKGKKII